MPSFPRFFIAVSALCTVLAAAVELIERAQQPDAYSGVDPMQRARELAVEGRWAEAKMLAEFVADNPGAGNPSEARELVVKAEAELDSHWRLVRSFTQGAVTGEPVDTASMLGSLSLDLFVVGDIRDIAVQGWREMYHGEGDIVILALSAVGLSTTLAPHLDWAPALLKALKKTGALTRDFLENLSRLSRKSMKTGDYAGLKAVSTDLGEAAVHLGPGPLNGALAAVDNTEDLARLAAASRVDARATYAVTTTLGNRGIRSINKNGGNITALAGTIKASSRFAKIASKWTGTIPTRWLWLLLFSALLIALLAIRPPTPKRRSLPRHLRKEPLLYPVMSTGVQRDPLN